MYNLRFLANKNQITAGLGKKLKSYLAKVVQCCIIKHISIKLSFIVGLCTGAVAIAVALILRLALSGPFIPEIASQTLFSLTPGSVESQAVGTLGPLAKYSAFIGAIIANLIVYGILAIFLLEGLIVLQRVIC